MSLSRRLFLQLSFSVSGLLTLGGLIHYLGYQSETSSAQTTFTLDQPSAYSIGSATHIAPARAWLFRDTQGLYAISMICPHLGCIVERRESDYLCPCHGSRFLHSADAVNGPADRGLNYIKLTLTADGKVQAHINKTVERTERLRL
jgi:cytochrome b6-f complex iron-sulfur subunit